VNAIIEVSATSRSTRYGTSLPPLSFVAGSGSAEF
jgi:hypothetical protein